MAPKLVLASQSDARASLLRQASVDFDIINARVDEAAVKESMLADGASPRDIVDALAELKAFRATSRTSAPLVLGADQVLVLEGKMYDKPVDLDQAREHLWQLRGKTHELLTASVIFEGARPVWRHIARAQLTVRHFSEEFVDDYIEVHGASLLSTVGAYRLEAGGAQLFSRIQGDYFSILGLPLLEVLSFLRTRGICRE
jgi:septum formation protein